MNVQYSGGKASFPAGSLYSCELVITQSASPSSSSSAKRPEQSSTKAHVQAVGFISIDTRWTKTAVDQSNFSDVFLQTLSFPINDRDLKNIPSFSTVLSSSSNNHNSASKSNNKAAYNGSASSHNQNYCIFATSREETSSYFFDITSNGAFAASRTNSNKIFVQFDLPPKLLPTFKGLSCSISYFLLLTFEATSGEIRHVSFPFNVTSTGCAYTPHYIRYAEITVYPSSEVPHDLKFTPLPDSLVASNNRSTVANGSFSYFDSAAEGTATNDDEDPFNLNCHYITYTITANDVVCTLSLLLAKNCIGSSSNRSCNGEYVLKLYPRDSFTITLDFDGCQQQCSFVTCKLLSIESRSDGSRVNEKVLTSSSKHVSDAVVVHFTMDIPAATFPSFTAQTCSLAHRLVLEFVVGEGGASEGQGGADVFTWSAEVEVLPPVHVLSPRAELNGTQETAIYYSTNIHL